MLELWYFTWVFLVIRPFFLGYHYFLPCDLDLGVWPIFLKTLTLLITFEQWELELWYFERQCSLMGTNNIDIFSLTLEFDLLFENFNHSKNFWTVSAAVHSFHINICSDKVFQWVPTFFTLTLEFDPFLLNFNLTKNFWTVSARALTFHMSIPCDKTFTRETWIFHKTKPSVGYQQFWTCYLDPGVWPTFWKL